MNAPRMRRLTADHRALTDAFSGHPHITVNPVGATPPERYQVEFRVPGLALSGGSQPYRTQSTWVTVTMPPDYPRAQPYLTADTPVFHPNFGAHVCIADFWFPGQTMVDILLQVAAMIQWQAYNIRSPLNAVAAQWSQTNLALLPVGNVQVSVNRPAAAVPPPAQPTQSNRPIAS